MQKNYSTILCLINISTVSVSCFLPTFKLFLAYKYTHNCDILFSYIPLIENGDDYDEDHSSFLSHVAAAVNRSSSFEDFARSRYIKYFCNGCSFDDYEETIDHSKSLCHCRELL
ncbi:hypothetical protein M9H77_29178 [Catharanthus roseus]|uniref:Uncharacterized protein n=1 Tax=Catharanthus roseus TaxID=4058 RepID=A0ACC0AHP6_CATRO|nr:hypothetical protein M9H77_29178 [Catharanthus roseus]